MDEITYSKRSLEQHDVSKKAFNVSLIESVLKHCKVPNYHDQNFLKIFFLLSTLTVMIQISGKILIWFEKVSSVKKLPLSNGERFLKSIFNLNLICKIVLTQKN